MVEGREMTGEVLLWAVADLDWVRVPAGRVCDGESAGTPMGLLSA